jgi:glycosyltransferase involved in cell wall biosynthesis
LVNRADTEGFADAIEELPNDVDQRRRVSAANRALATERFDRAEFRSRVADLYRRHGRVTSATRGK